MKAKHSKGKRHRAKGRTASRAINAARRLKIIPVLIKDMNRMADWMNATGTVQVAIIEAMQSYIDQAKGVDDFVLTDKVNDIVKAHIASQQAAQPQPITEPAPDPEILEAVNKLSQQIAEPPDQESHAADPPST
jgi:hypothetical protein